MKIVEKKIDEALPKDLIGPYKRRTFQNPGLDNRALDIQNSGATEITPEQALAIMKTNPSSIRAIIKDSGGRDRVITFNDRGKVAAENSFEMRWGDPRLYTTKSGEGETKNKLSKMPGKYVLGLADKIYQVNEVAKDSTLVDTRAQNPESPNYRGSGLNSDDVYQVNKIKRDISSPDKQKYIKIDSNRVKKLDNGQVYVDGYYGGTGDSAFWEEKYNDYKRRYGWVDGDTQRAYQAWQLARGVNADEIPNPNYTDPSVEKARLRYYDTEKMLKRPIQLAKNTLKSLNNAKMLKDNAEAKKRDFTSPEARASRESSIKSDIDYYRRQVLNYLANLERYEANLDELDDKDLKQIKEYDDKISDLAKQIADLQTQLSDPKNSIFRGSLGNPVPESLQEGKSLDELVDEAEVNEDDTQEDIISKYTN